MREDTKSPDRQKPGDDPGEPDLNESVIAELTELARRTRPKIQGEPKDIKPEQSGQLSPPHTPRRRR